jgi:hypothetical protein
VRDITKHYNAINLSTELVISVKGGMQQQGFVSGGIMCKLLRIKVTINRPTR